MAVFTKATLVGSVVIAYRQRIWSTFRRKTMSMGAIDSLFAIADDPTMFWDGDMVRRYPPGSVGEDRDRHKRNGWDD